VDTKFREIVTGILFRETCQFGSLDPGHILNQIVSNKILSAKVRNIYLRNFAEFHEIIVAKFREINFNVVLFSYFA
jgi:hypothetical protein